MIRGWNSTVAYIQKGWPPYHIVGVLVPFAVNVLELEFRFMCTSSERTGVRNCATKVSGFSGPNDIHTKVRIWWISHALARNAFFHLRWIPNFGQGAVGIP